MIDKKTRCKCGAEFCYLCSKRWKSCSCDRWDELNLVRRAEQVVDREADYPLDPRERQRRFVQIREDLVDQDQCEHPGKFQRVFGDGELELECEMCEQRHWGYILQCRRCHLRVCEVCRRHRVR